MAPVGQTCVHAPHPTHIPAFTTALPASLRLMAPRGHIFTQRPQPVQSDASTTAIRRSVATGTCCGKFGCAPMNGICPPNACLRPPPPPRLLPMPIVLTPHLIVHRNPSLHPLRFTCQVRDRHSGHFSRRPTCQISSHSAKPRIAFASSSKHRVSLYAHLLILYRAFAPVSK